MELARLIEEQEVDIVCLQEPHLRNGKITGMPHKYTTIHHTDAMAAIIVTNPQYTITQISSLYHAPCHCENNHRKD